ncbi:hypothetical protein KFE96_06865 [Kordiimonas sp. SCSIO 12603]|uniref:hypothetical protein n=1 Tax=Kordiimonas sp. SCSIO 12603 TaxID=2829596 RepID=UPI002104767C|nr:hypothetical protein [Kordiimonas sp. SCSIO 12603]UTW60023.1 hypothetical protein KFE96_06865 [Kordiimonas sp. SCSIO 12603]
MLDLLTKAKDELVEGEEILWHGQGGSKIHFTGLQITLFAFAVFLVMWVLIGGLVQLVSADLDTAIEYVTGTTKLMLLVQAIPLFTIGYSEAERTANERKASLYVLTNKGAIRCTHKGVFCYNYNELKTIHLKKHRNGAEAIIFEPKKTQAVLGYKGYRFFGNGGLVSFAVLEDAAGAKAVLSRIVPDKLDGEFTGAVV